MGFGSIAPYYDPMTGLPIGAPETDVATVPPVVVPKVPIVAPVEDWREREAQAGLALQQADKLKAERAAQTWGSLAREIPGNLLNMAKGLVAPALPADPNAPPSLGPAAFGTMSPGEAALQPETTGGRVVRGVGNMIAEGAKSGFTAPHDAAAGDILEWTPEGHTSPAMVHRGFDTAALAGGASAGGTAERLASSPGLDFRVAGKQLASDSGKPGAAVAAAERSYPMAPRDNWYGSANYETAGGKMEKMSPDDFLAQSRPMKMDELTRENVDDLKRHIESGGELDPLQLYGNGKEDGRHRAIAAKELGIKELPVINFRSDTAKPGAAISALEHAPPFYSHLEQAVTEAPIKKATGEQWLGTLSNKPGVKPEEMDWTGLRTFLKEKADQPVTKEEVAAHIGENKVQLGEVHKGYNAQKEARSAELNARPEESLTQAEYQELRALDDTGATDAKFENYQLPGGENYREKLLTMPINLDEAAMQKYGKPYSDLPRGQQVSTRQGAGGYKSSHWDEPNVLVHRRTNERDVGGVPSLHVEELQSDWHQAGRKSGYASDIPALKAEREALSSKKLGDDIGGGKTVQDRLGEIDDVLNNQGSAVPDAPFKKTGDWTALGLKDAIREAAEKGIDRISITPGDIHPTNPKNLGQSGAEADRASEGMKGYYDKIVPDALNKIGKPHGVKVQAGATADGSRVMQAGPQDWRIVDASGKGGRKPNGDPLSFKSQAEAQASIQGSPVHYMDIPPSLKEQALKKGFSLFEDTGPTATALAVAERAGYVNPHEAAAAARGAEAPLRGGGGARGVEEAQAAAARHAGAVEPLAGLPSKPLTVGGERDSDKINIDYATAFRDLKARSGGVVPEPAAAVVPAPSGGRPADKADVSRASAGSGKGSKKAARQKVSSFGSIAPGMVG